MPRWIFVPFKNTEKTTSNFHDSTDTRLGAVFQNSPSGTEPFEQHRHTRSLSREKKLFPRKKTHAEPLLGTLCLGCRYVCVSTAAVGKKREKTKKKKKNERMTEQVGVSRSTARWGGSGAAGRRPGSGPARAGGRVPSGRWAPAGVRRPVRLRGSWSSGPGCYAGGTCSASRPAMVFLDPVVVAR